MLLAVQLVWIFGLVPAIAEGVQVPAGAAVVLLLVFMSLTIVMARGRWALAVGLGTLALAAASVVVRHLFRDVLADVFRPGRFTSHRVRGAVVLYLNLGLMFGFADRMVAELMPDAYAHVPGPGNEATFRAAFEYFSFTTLTSVGYGDIVAVRPVARSLATLEAMLGQMLPTVLIARVVILAMREE